MNYYVAYLRLSKKYHDSEYYGLEAQRDAIEKEVRKNKGTILQFYTEIESGTRKNLDRRVEIKKALAHCRDTGAKLVVAKLDRLARDTEFILSIVNSDVEVVFCDFKFEGIAGKMLLTIISAFSEYEAKRISERTKDGLKIAKKRGVKLGNPNLDPAKAGRASGEARRRKAHLQSNVMAKGRIDMLKKQGKSNREIAEILNSEGLRSTRGKKFNRDIVRKILS